LPAYIKKRPQAQKGAFDPAKSPFSKKAKIKGYLLEFPGMSQEGEQQCSLCYSAKQT
jgi:hypothetical protein